jgi:hypothetical protein
MTPLVTSDARDPVFFSFVCEELFLAIWTLGVIIAHLVTLNKDGLFKVIIRV